MPSRSTFGTPGDAARVAEVSAVMVGRILDNMGLRDHGKLTEKAEHAGIVSEHYPKSWTPYAVTDWHSEMTKKVERPKAEKVRMVVLEGNTYDHREAIKAAGGKWDALRKVWHVPEPQFAALSSQIGAGLQRAKVKAWY